MTVRVAPSGLISQLDVIWLVSPYALLIATTILAWTSGDLTGAAVPVALIAGALLVVWHSWWTLGHRHWLERALAPMVVYYLGLLALTTTLLHLSFSYFALYLVCYPMAFVALPGYWAYGGLALTSTVALVLPRLMSWTLMNLIITLASTVLVAAAGWSIRALERETVARRASEAELARINDDLKRALAENNALQDRLVLEAREAGVSAERARLAADIHDTLAAALTGIVSQLEALDAGLDSDHPMRHRLVASTDLARDSLREARHAVQALRPASLSGATLERALAELTDIAQRTHSLGASFQATGTPVEIPDDVEDALVRIAREALNNTGRHAKADRVRVTLSYLEDTVAIDVADDGRGFDDAGQATAGHGISIMQERARAIGGRVDVTRGETTGTTITVSVPLATTVGKQ